MGFTKQEIVTAFRQAAGVTGPEDSLSKSAHFWEAAARNAWVLGALGSALNFTIALGSESGGIADIANRMIQSFVVTLYGLVLAVICLVPSMKLFVRAEDARFEGETRPVTEAAHPPHVTSRGTTVDRIIGYVLFAAVLILTILLLIGGQPQGGLHPMGKVLLHWPAVLVVIGGAIALALFMGVGAGARAWTLGFAMTGLIGLLAGVIQTLFGFVHKDIAEVSSALSFIISASSLSLLGLLAVAAPLEDREVMEGRKEKPSSLSRLFWAVFPLLTLIFLILTFIMVVTPMDKPGG